MKHILTLRGKSRKGKNRIREHGAKWEVIEKPKVGKAWNGLAVPLRSLEDEANLNWRWLEIENDPDFEVIDEEVTDCCFAHCEMPDACPRKFSFIFFSDRA